MDISLPDHSKMDETPSDPRHEVSMEDSKTGSSGTISSMPSKTPERYLFELKIDSGQSDEQSMFSAISTPLVLHDDASSFQYDKLKLDSLGLYGRDTEKET